MRLLIQKKWDQLAPAFNTVIDKMASYKPFSDKKYENVLNRVNHFHGQLLIINVKRDAIQQEATHRRSIYSRQIKEIDNAANLFKWTQKEKDEEHLLPAKKEFEKKMKELSTQAEDVKEQLERLLKF